MNGIDSTCLDVDEMEQFAKFATDASDALTRAQRMRIELHIDRCALCRRGISELVRSFEAESDFFCDEGRWCDSPP